MELILSILLIAALGIWLYRRGRAGRDTLSTPEKSSMSMDERYNLERTKKEKELDQLLEKINKKGLQSLSAKEKERLKELSR